MPPDPPRNTVKYKQEPTHFTFGGNGPVIVLFLCTYCVCKTSRRHFHTTNVPALDHDKSHQRSLKQWITGFQYLNKII